MLTRISAGVQVIDHPYSFTFYSYDPYWLQNYKFFLILINIKTPNWLLNNRVSTSVCFIRVFEHLCLTMHVHTIIQLNGCPPLPPHIINMYLGLESFHMRPLTPIQMLSLDHHRSEVVWKRWDSKTHHSQCISVQVSWSVLFGHWQLFITIKTN